MAETPLERVDALLLREDHAQQGEVNGGDAMAPRGRGRRPAGLPVPFRGEVAPARDAPWIGNGVLDRFLEDESLFGEFLRTPVSEGGVEPLVVEPPHVVVEVGA